MICNNCGADVGFLVNVVKELYDEEGLPRDSSNEFWCANCVTSTNVDDTDASIGVDVADNR